MGNTLFSRAQDAFGGSLVEGDYVECTTSAFGDVTQSIGRVVYIQDMWVTFKWPIWGTYTYNENDIRYHKLRKVVVDREGRKLKVDQMVDLYDGREAVVTAVSTDYLTLKFTGRDIYGNFRGAGFGNLSSDSNSYQNFRQMDVDECGIRVSSAIGRSNRRCTNGACL